jgi:hypothetical protein
MGWTHSSDVEVGNDSHTGIKGEILVEGGHVAQFRHVAQFNVKKDENNIKMNIT